MICNDNFLLKFLSKEIDHIFIKSQFFRYSIEEVDGLDFFFF